MSTLNHHSPTGECLFCEEKLKQAHPLLGEWYHLIRAHFANAHISWTFRDQATQDLFYNQGKSKVKWPNSAHNKMKDGKPYAMAMDLFGIRSDGVGIFNKPYYEPLAAWLLEQKSPLFWGGRFHQFYDGDHFQLKLDEE